MHPQAQLQRVQQQPVAALGAHARANFVSKTYSHLFGALVAFVLAEMLIFRLGWAEGIQTATRSVHPILYVVAFFAVAYGARALAHAPSRSVQYLGFAVTILFWSVIVAPLLLFADKFAGGGVIASAAIVSLVGFSGLTAIVFTTRKDFSFLRPFVSWITLMAMLGIAASAIFGFTLGTWFIVAVILLVGAMILYQTSAVLHSYPENMYVGAALELFVSVVILFQYVLMIFLNQE